MVLPRVVLPRVMLPRMVLPRVAFGVWESGPFSGLLAALSVSRPLAPGFRVHCSGYLLAGARLFSVTQLKDRKTAHS